MSGALKSHEWSREVVMLTAGDQDTALVLTTQNISLPTETHLLLLRVLMGACRQGVRGTSDVLVYTVGLVIGPLFDSAFFPCH